MAPALSEACSVRRKPDIGSREPVKQHLQRKVPSSPVAASPPPSPPVASLGDKLQQARPGTLDPCFAAPATGDTPPRHCLSPLSPPLSPPATDHDATRRFILDLAAKKVVVAATAAAAAVVGDQTCDLDLDCHLPDSPSSQLSVAHCPRGLVEFTLPPHPPPPSSLMSAAAAPQDTAAIIMQLTEKAKARQVEAHRSRSRSLRRARCITISLIYANALRLAKCVVVAKKKRPEEVTVGEASEDALRTGATLRELEERFEIRQTAKRYLNRLQSVTTFNERLGVKRKLPGASLDIMVCPTRHDADGDEDDDDVVDDEGLDATTKKKNKSQKKPRLLTSEESGEMSSLFGRLGQLLSRHDHWKRVDGGDGMDEEVVDDGDDYGEATESSSGGESCDEHEGMGSRVRAPRQDRIGATVPSIERRALSRWLVDSHTLGARWSWLQIKSDNLIKAAHSLENQRRTLRLKKGCVLETDYANFLAPGLDGSYRKNGYLMGEPTESGLGSVVSPCAALEDLAGIPSPAASEEDRRPPETSSRCVPLSKLFQRRRIVRVPPHRRPDDAPRSLAEFENPVLAASKIHAAIHPVLSSMKDVPLSAHLDSLLLELSRTETSAEQSQRNRLSGGDGGTEEEDESERCPSRGSSRATGSGVAGGSSRSKPGLGSPKASSSGRYKDRYRDKARRKAKWDRRDGRKSSSRVDSTASSPARNGSSSRGKKRSRTESNSSDQRRHKSRLSSKSQPGSSREASPYDLSRQGSRKDRGSTSSTTTTAAASTAHRRARADQSYDIDSIVIPSYSMCSLKPTKVEYKEIPTPRWRPITPASQAYQQTWRNHSEVASSKRVMLDHLFAVLHFSSEEEERRRLMGTTGAVAQGRGRARKNTVNASSGTLTPARATSPLSVDQGSEQSGAFSPSLSSPPPTPQSMDAIAADSRDLYTSSKSSLRGKTFGARSASKDEHLHSPESSSYYERRKFPMSESEFASVLHREAEDGGEHGKRVVGQRATKPPIKWDDTGPNLSESSDDSDDELSEDESWDAHVKQKCVAGPFRGPPPTSTTPASSNMATTPRVPAFNS